MFTQAEIANLPLGEYASPGPLRDFLVAAIISGKKTATSSLLVEYERTNAPLPRPGDREVVINSAGKPVCVTEVKQVTIVPFHGVSLQHAHKEGEGFTDVAQWRKAHHSFWSSPEYEPASGVTPIALTADTAIVCVTFTVIQHLV